MKGRASLPTSALLGTSVVVALVLLLMAWLGSADGNATPATATSGKEQIDVASRAQAERTYRVFRAGTVTIRHQAGTVTVVKVVPRPGWRHRIERDDDRDEVEVEFRKRGNKVDFEAEIDDGRLEVSLCRTVGGRQGSYRVNPAGTVRVARVGDEDLRVVGVQARPGWRYRIEEQNEEEVEVEFRRGERRIDFEAERENGRIEAEVCRVLRD